jgi:hypothetical protein
MSYGADIVTFTTRASMVLLSKDSSRTAFLTLAHGSALLIGQVAGRPSGTASPGWNGVAAAYG